MQTGLLKIVPKLGLQYLHAVLREHNFPVIFLDQEVEDFNISSISAKFNEYTPLFIGIYSSERIRAATIRFVQQLRKTRPEVIIVIGGPDYFSYEEYLNAGCTFVCHGEGEKTILDIARYASGELDKGTLKGVYLRQGQAIKPAATQESIAELDTLPFPVREHIRKYADYHYLGMRKPYVHMITSRGCGYNCSYCSSPYIWGQKVRRRSVENVLSEIDYLVKQHRVKYISFKDDRFFPDLNWLKALCHALIQRNYKLRFNCSVCPSDFKTAWEEKIDLLKAAGCDALIFGLQSTDKTVLKNIHRNPDDVDSLRPVIAYANRVRLFTIVEFIFGLPGDSKESLQSAIRYAIDLKPYFIQFNRLLLLKGSELSARIARGYSQCRLTEREIKKIILQGYLRFYLDPAVLYKNIRYIFENNPRWFIDARQVYKYPFLGLYYYFRGSKTS